MANHVNQLLTSRLKKSDKSSKMAEMAKQSATGNLTSFSGIFSIAELNEGEKDTLEAILYQFANGNENISLDLRSLITITSEVKAISNQAAILHGERIKQAQEVLMKYKEGAFTTWLIATYGNRQTPYNFLQYFEFCNAMPKLLRPQIELMPRQAVYTLASREGALEKKQEIVENYKGETKTEILQVIREAFPLNLEDKRKSNVGDSAINSLNRLIHLIDSQRARLSKTQKNQILEMINQLVDCVEQCKTR